MQHMNVWCTTDHLTGIRVWFALCQSAVRCASKGAPARLGVVVDRVRVGEDAAAGDDEAAAGGRVLPLPLPGQREVGLGVHAEDLRARAPGTSAPTHPSTLSGEVRRESTNAATCSLAAHGLGHRLWSM